MTEIQIAITAVIIVAATMLTRFAAFILFPKDKPVPKTVSYLGKVLPGAVMGFLLIYCLKDIDIYHMPFGIPDLMCVCLVFLLYRFTKNTLISVGLGTAVYVFIQYLPM